MIQFDEHIFQMGWNQLVQELDTKNMILFFVEKNNRTAPKKNPWQMFWKKLRKRQDETWNNLVELSGSIPSVAKNSVGISNVSLAIYPFSDFNPQNIARKVFLSGYPTVAGRYLLQPELKNGRPVYRGVTGQGGLM